MDSCARSLAEAAGRALGAVISKFKMLKNVDAGVKTVYACSGGVWDIKSKDIDMVQNRAMRYFLGVHRLAPSAGLTHRGRVTHICVGNLTIIGSDNGLSPGRRQAIIWTNAGILLIGP